MNMSGETYIVCDTAGFDDTRAVEYDIASGIVMTNAIRSTRSVKLVLVIDQGTIAMRLSNLRKNLIPAIIKLIPSFKSYVGSVFYLFNMISDPIKTVAARLREISRNLNPAEKADADFAAMISDLAKKSATEKHAAVTDFLARSLIIAAKSASAFSAGLRFMLISLNRAATVFIGSDIMLNK